MALSLHPIDFLKHIHDDLGRAPIDDIILHRNQAKFLLEEKLPLALLAYQLTLLGDDVTVEYYGSNHELSDGLIRYHGKEILVEVTYCHSYENSLRNELVVAEGSAPGAGPIFRDMQTNRIQAEGTAIASDAELEKLKLDLVARIEHKVAKDYATNTVLIVAFEFVTENGISFWRQLDEPLRNTKKGPFSSVYLCNIITKQIICFL